MPIYLHLIPMLALLLVLLFHFIISKIRGE